MGTLTDMKLRILCRSRVLRRAGSVLRVVLLQRHHRLGAVLPGGECRPRASVASLQQHVEHGGVLGRRPGRRGAQRLRKVPALARLRVLPVSAFLTLTCISLRKAADAHA